MVGGHADRAGGGARGEYLDILAEPLAPGRQHFDWELGARHLFGLGRLDDLLDRALEEERRLRHLIVLALDDLFEAADRFGDRHIGAWRAGELFGDEERLREEALDLARALDD